jgi:hypothetical protein
MTVTVRARPVLARDRSGFIHRVYETGDTPLCDPRCGSRLVEGFEFVDATVVEQAEEGQLCRFCFARSNGKVRR